MVAGVRSRGDSVSLHEIQDDERLFANHEELLQRGCWDRFKRGARVLWGGALGITSLAVRVLGFGPWPNALSSLGLGIATMRCIDTTIKICFPTWSMLRVRNIARTVFGGTMVFFADVLRWPDEPPRAEQKASSTFIIIALGANTYLIFKILLENRGNRMEANLRLLAPNNGPRFHSIFAEKWWLKDLALRGSAIAGATTCAVLAEDPVYRALSGMTAAYYFSQIPGDYAMDFIDQKIDESDAVGQQMDLIEERGSRYRFGKIFVLTSGAIVIPIALIPFLGNAHTTKRIQQLIGDGAVIGLFDSAMHQAFERRLRNTPIQRLDEVKFCYREEENSFYRIWSVVVPALAAAGMVGVTMWQIGWEVDELLQQGEMGALLGGFVGTTIITHLIDRSWDEEQRIEQEANITPSVLIKDKFFITFLLTKRFLGIPPAYIFSAITNAVAMNAQSDSYPALKIIGWFSYGVALALELYGTSGRRRGVGYQFVLVAMINGALTFKRVAVGDIL